MKEKSVFDVLNTVSTKAMIFSVIFWIAVLIVNQEPEIATVFIDGGLSGTGAVLGVFCAFLLSYMVVFLMIYLANAMVKESEFSTLADNFVFSFINAMYLTIALVGGFLHGADTLYNQYSAIEFIPIQLGMFSVFWILFYAEQISISAFSGFGSIFKVKNDGKDTHSDRSGDQSISWSFDEDK